MLKTIQKNVEITDARYGNRTANTVALQFKSRFDVANWIERTPNPYENEPDTSYKSSTKPNNGGWSGSASLEDSLKLLRYGDPDKGKELKNVRDGMKTKTGTTDVSLSYHSNIPERGPSLDIGRFVQDDPDMWLNHRTRVIDGRGHRLVKVFINVSVSAGVSSKDIFRRAVNAGIAIKELKQAGYSVGLYAGELTDFQGKRDDNGITRIETSIKIAEWGHEVTDNVLAFIAGNPSFLRRVIFACNERSGYMENIGRRYGSPVGGAATPTFDRFDICFNLSNDMSKSTEDIIEGLKK